MKTMDRRRLLGAIVCGAAAVSFWRPRPSRRCRSTRTSGTVCPTRSRRLRSSWSIRGAGAACGAAGGTGVVASAAGAGSDTRRGGMDRRLGVAVPSIRLALLAVAASFLSTIGQASSESNSQLTQELSNPVANLIQVPFQNNFDWGGGPRNSAFRYTLNIQPVIPLLARSAIGTLITRTIVPVRVLRRPLSADRDRGSATPCKASFSRPPVRRRPESSGARGRFFSTRPRRTPFFAGRQWGAGPTGVILQLNGPWTYGMLANHVWSLTNVPSPNARRRAPIQIRNRRNDCGRPDHPGPVADQQHLSAAVRLTYAFPTHTTVSLSSETQYNWTTRQWTIPIAAGVNQLVRVGGQIVQLGGTFRYWVERPTGGPTWGLRFRRPGSCRRVVDRPNLQRP